MEKYVPEKICFPLIRWYVGKSRGERIFEIVNCHFKGRADIQNKIQPDQLYELTGESKGQ